MDAITKGTFQGIQLLLSIIAMILVLVALVHLINAILGIGPDVSGGPLTLQRLLVVPWRRPSLFHHSMQSFL